MACARATTLRANTLKSSAEHVAPALDAQGITWSTPPFYRDAFILPPHSEQAVRALDLYDRGEVYLQSLSAMLPPLALDPHEDETVLDMAAAPGGKTCQMSALAAGRVLITACEKNAVRAQKLRHNLEKQGVGRCSVMEADARTLDEFFTFDKVLLDAPCSGSGTASLEGGSYRGGFTLELLERSVRTQRSLLQRALEAARPGGLVVYATCSILPDENERVIEYVLSGGAAKEKRPARGKRGRGKEAPRIPQRVRAEVEPLPPALLEGVPLLPCSLEGAACVKPTSCYEGFFVAALRRLS